MFEVLTPHKNARLLVIMLVSALFALISTGLLVSERSVVPQLLGSDDFINGLSTPRLASDDFINGLPTPRLASDDFINGLPTPRLASDDFINGLPTLRLASDDFINGLPTLLRV